MTRALLVEDNEQNRGLMRYLLRAGGFECLEASDGRRGVECAQAERPDIVLMDLQMPDMDGFAALAAIRADPAIASTPVVAVTAYSMAGDREKALSAGFAGYISKPIDPWTFVETVQGYLATTFVDT